MPLLRRLVTLFPKVNCLWILLPTICLMRKLGRRLLLSVQTMLKILLMRAREVILIEGIEMVKVHIGPS